MQFTDKKNLFKYICLKKQNNYAVSILLRFILAIYISIDDIVIIDNKYDNHTHQTPGGGGERVMFHIRV